MKEYIIGFAMEICCIAMQHSKIYFFTRVLNYRKKNKTKENKKKKRYKLKILKLYFQYQIHRRRERLEVQNIENLIQNIRKFKARFAKIFRDCQESAR